MVTLENYKISPSKKVIDDIKIQVVYIPLVSSLGYKYKPIVSVGDYVCIGSKLGESVSTDLLLTSSVSGTVVGFTEMYIMDGNLVDCIVIENDFKEKYQDKVGKKLDITKYSKKEFIYMLKNSGISGMSGSDYPTYLKYENYDNIKYLIVNGAECDPYVSSDSAVMFNHTEEILECVDAIMEIMHIDKAYIAIDEYNDKVIKSFLKHINTYPNIKIYSLMNGYPNGYERYLVNEILGLDYKEKTQEVGVICNNVSTIYAIYEMLKYHKPLVDRVVTITGAGIKKPGNYLLKIGTSLSEFILKTDGYTKTKNPILVAGGAMRGKAIPNDSLIVTKNLNCIIVSDFQEETSDICIKCGKCTEVCPMGIMPSLIMNNPKDYKKLKLDKCIKCGLCSYVCPSKIPVREILTNIEEGKNERI